MIPWLRHGALFPAVTTALTEPNGLLCASLELNSKLLFHAYLRGIFPWYSEGEPVLWWSPDPRMVLPVREFHVTRSFRKTLRKVASSTDLELRIDRDFLAVMRACAAPREGQEGTWISPAIIEAYDDLHQQGLAHSFELLDQGELIGGLYGVSIGRMFYGESMFSRRTDASKIALAALVQVLQLEQVSLVDCQQNTAHLASLGAREISRYEFCKHVAQSVQATPINWAAYQSQPLNRLLLAY